MVPLQSLRKIETPLYQVKLFFILVLSWIAQPMIKMHPCDNLMFLAFTDHLVVLALSIILIYRDAFHCLL